MKAAIDNDVLYKGAWFGLIHEFIAAIPTSSSDACVLGEARFVIGKRLERQLKERGTEAARALAHFHEVLAGLAVVEPSDDEQQLAAEFEHQAQLAGLPLDGGESLLCAVVLCRGLDLLSTGDKRAIRALSGLQAKHDAIKKLAGRILCLEQLVLRLLTRADRPPLRTLICAAPHADKALAICFSCTNPAERQQDWIEALNSYINSVRAEAPTLLAPDSLSLL